MPSPTPGVGRYAQSEREQRWLFGRLPDERWDPVEISDRYLTGSRLRLRRMQSDREVVWKLGRKVHVHGDSPERVRLTNLYLDEREYTMLAGLDASVLTKTRWRWEFGRHTMSADVFHGTLKGLMLAEARWVPTTIFSSCQWARCVMSQKMTDSLVALLLHSTRTRLRFLWNSLSK